MELTPVENHNGLWVKREDLYRSEEFGVNGAKYRACQHLIGQAVEAGARRVVSASSVLSPQAAMAAVVAREHGLESHIVMGGTTPEKAIPVHRSLQIAQAAGATFEAIAVGYNPALQKRSAELASEPGNWRLPYGITTEADASREAVEAFLRVGAPQTFNLPDEIETLVVPFGSGNTAAGVLTGLHDFAPASLKKVILVGIGPDRLGWLEDRLRKVLDLPLVPRGVELQHSPLHPWFATYGDRMPETLDGIVLHPTYEGKVVRFLNTAQPEWWTRPADKTALWIVGGPLP